MIKKSKFWPLDYEPEDEIYENLSWDLPGLRRTARRRAPDTRQTRIAIGN